MELNDLGELATGSGFRVFEETIASGGRVFGLAAPGMATRQPLDPSTS